MSNSLTKSDLRAYFNRTFDESMRFKERVGHNDPTDEHYQAELDSMAHLSDQSSEVKAIKNYIKRTSFDQLSVLERLEKLETRRNDELSSAVLTIPTTGQSIPPTNTTTVNWKVLNADGDSLIEHLNLSHQNGVFTYTNPSPAIFLLSYQIRFESATSGVREAKISTLLGDLARIQVPNVSGNATHVSSCATLRMTNRDTFSVQVAHTNPLAINLVTASSGTKLMITRL